MVWRRHDPSVLVHDFLPRFLSTFTSESCVIMNRRSCKGDPGGPRDGDIIPVLSGHRPDALSGNYILLEDSYRFSPSIARIFRGLVDILPFRGYHPRRRMGSSRKSLCGAVALSL
jgi:hypothetical protein